ncbi:MAG: phosphatidate cytidylyltransferase [Candidatus Eremiobacteraeota bacterium]|nr:phosphatidate cytidylyltransferase [Candidatus Eremiobacteraeota bacterium]
MFLKRIIVGAFLIVGSFLLVMMGTWAMALEVLIIGILGLNEFYNLAYRKGIRPSKITGLLCGIILYFTAFFLNEEKSLVVLTVLIIYTLFIFIFRKESHVSSFLDAGVTLLGYLYIGWLFSFIIHLRGMDEPAMLGPYHIERGALYVVFLVFATSFTDIGSFFVGKFLGRHKLCPSISPGKTIEGAIGGIIIALLFSGTWGFFSGIPLFHCIVLSIVISIFAMLGDLWESTLKRDVSVKDSGDIVAGHGGILDRFDSLFITSPVAYLYFKYFVHFL